MRKILRVARRGYRATVRTKGFLIGLLLAPVLMGGSAIAFALLKDRVDTRDQHLAVIDRSGLVGEALVEAARVRDDREVRDAETGRKRKPAYRLEVVTPDVENPDAQRLALSDRIRRGELYAFLDVGPGVLHPRRDREAARIRYHAKNPALDDLRRWVAGPINERLRKLRLAEAGVDEGAVQDLFDWISAEGLGLVSVDAVSGAIKDGQRRDRIEAILLPLILPMLLFVMLMMGAQPLLSAVVEEKSQRIAELVLGSIRPFGFMMGKLIGGACVSLTAALVYVVLGVFLVRYMGLESYIPYDLLPWLFAFLVLAIFMFGALFAAVGAMCNDSNELQAVTFPAILPMLIPMFILMPVVTQPLSSFATGMSLFPLFTPMLMLLRLGTPGGVPAWQPWVGVVGVLACTLFFVWAGGRVFRVGILMQGTPPKFRNLVRWAFRA